MKRFIVSVTCLLLTLFIAQGVSLAEGNGKLASGTGNLLRGAVYKQSGVARDGVITIRTKWVLPSAPPVYRYDFDVLYGTIEGSLYSYLMADIAEIEFLPADEGRQPVNIRLRNGLIQKASLTTEDKGVLGKVSLRIKEVDVITDGYGENIIPGGDVQKIVFSGPQAASEEDIPALVSTFKKALEVGKRDGLIDKDFLAVLENIQKRAQEKMKK
jgi:hypothetical protein